MSLWPPYTLTGIIDENGDRFQTWKYQNLYTPLVTRSEHAGGVDATDLSSNGTTASVTDAFNVSRTYYFTPIQGSAKFTGIDVSYYRNPCPSCGPVAQTWDTNGFLASRMDWNGNRSCFKHDTRGLENVRVEGLTGACPVDLTLTSVPSAAPARKITTQWHPIWRLPTMVAEPLRMTSYVYHGDGGVTCGATGSLCSKTVQSTNDATGALGLGATLSGNPRIWTYTYNVAGQMLTTDDPRSDVNDITAYTYDTQGNIATVTNALGQVTQVTAYDAHGKPLTIVDPNGLTTSLAYDARQRLISRNVGGETTVYAYDGVGQVTRVTLPDSSYLAYTYDAAHRLTGLADNLGNKITYTLDAMGNRTQEQVFDPANSLAQTRSRVYSNLNRLFQDIGAQGQTTQYAYDDQGNVTGITDPLNRVTANAYDALNRLMQVTDPGTGATKYGYNGLDQLTQVTDPRNLVTGYTVDGLGNLTQQTSPDTGTSTSTYDTAGNLLTRTDAKGQVASYAYDALNRVTSITFHDGSKQTYAYDQGANGIGRLTQVTETDPANQVTNQIAYAYDQKGRVLTETRTVSGVAYVNAYSYDSAGRLSGMTYPSGRTVTYSFDALGRIAGVTTAKDGNTKTVVSNVAYQPFGGVKSFGYGNGQTYTRQYDQDGRIAAYTLGATQFNLGFDAASRIGFIAENGNAANTNNYGYDALDRLTQAMLPATGFGYGYDAVGNRLTKTTGANTDSYTYGATSNRLVSIAPASGPARSFAFDANGSTTADGTNQYAYDTRGRLIQAISSAGTSQYQINALGQRVQKTAPGTNGPVATVFHYDARGRLIAEGTVAGAFKREYLYLSDIPIAVVVVP